MLSGRYRHTVRIKRETLIAFGTIGLLAAVPCIPLLRFGASNGFDIDNALVWMKYFGAQVVEGDWYPRWLMDMNRGAGSPAFYYYPPLAYYIAMLPALVFPGRGLTVQLAWADLLLLSLSGCSFYLYARRRFGVVACLVCSGLYMLLPYHFEIDLWRRQDLAELASYIVMPAVLYFTDEFFESRRGTVGLSVSYALLLLAHLPAALLFSICLAAYILSSPYGRFLAAPLLRFVGVISVGLLLAGIYWIPALFTQQYIHAEAWWSWQYDFHMWFFPVRTFADFHNVSELRNFNARVFTVVIVTTMIFAACWCAAVIANRDGRDTAKLRGQIVVVCVVWFLMSSVSAIVWERTPLLAKVQFPSRLGMMMDLVTAITALYAMRSLAAGKRSAVAAIVASAILMVWYAMTADVKGKLDPYYPPEWIRARGEHVEKGIEAPEYTTRWSPFDASADDNSAELEDFPMVTFDRKKGGVVVTSWRPRNIELEVTLRDRATVRLRQFYFPNWKANIGGVIPLRVVPSNEDGLIRVDLPSGHYTVAVNLAWLPQELIGGLFSAAGMLVLFLGSERFGFGSGMLSITRRRRDQG